MMTGGINSQLVYGAWAYVSAKAALQVAAAGFKQQQQPLNGRCCPLVNSFGKLYISEIQRLASPP